MLELKHHAQIRSSQRNVSEEELWYVVEHGQRFHRAGAIFYYLRDCDIAEDDQKSDLARLAGTAVILNKAGEQVITIWRNRSKGLKNIKRKLKRSSKVETLRLRHT